MHGTLQDIHVTETGGTSTAVYSYNLQHAMRYFKVTAQKAQGTTNILAPNLHCMELPRDEFNGMISEQQLAVQAKSFTS